MKSIREKIFQLLLESKHFLSVSEIRAILRIGKEINIYKELYHIYKSAKAKGFNFLVKPAYCKKCNFIFKDKIFGKPSKCPKCKSTYIEEAKYKIEKE